MEQKKVVDFHSRKLEILLMTVELGSFTRAAEVIGYTQSGLTHMMDSLEKELGVRMLVRGHNGVRLTEAGQQLLPSIRDFLRANAALDNAVKNISAKEKDTIHVGAYASIAINWLPDILYKFRGICPEADVDLRMIDNAVIPFELLESGEMDIIFASRQDFAGYDWIPLYNEPMYAVLPSNFMPNAKNRQSGSLKRSGSWKRSGSCKKKFPVEWFEGEKFIMPHGAFELDVKRAIGDVKPDIQPASVDDAAVITMVEHGLGVSLMAELMLNGRNKNVQCVSLDPPAVRELGMAVRSGSDTPEPVKQLIRCVLENLKV